MFTSTRSGALSPIRPTVSSLHRLQFSLQRKVPAASVARAPYRLLQLSAPRAPPTAPAALPPRRIRPGSTRVDSVSRSATAWKVRLFQYVLERPYVAGHCLLMTRACQLYTGDNATASGLHAPGRGDIEPSRAWNGWSYVTVSGFGSLVFKRSQIFIIGPSLLCTVL